MAKYDGLIIPRSYNDYINKSDPAGVSQALQLTGVMDNAPTAQSTKPAKSGGIFAANAVIMASSATLTGVAISAGSVVRVLFTADLTGSNTTTGLILTYNGNAYAVKVGKNGALAAFVASEISSGVFKYLQAYTTLELMFDGTQFIIIGNPVVLSSTDYTIYADGSITYSNNNLIKLINHSINYTDNNVHYNCNDYLNKNIEIFANVEQFTNLPAFASEGLIAWFISRGENLFHTDAARDYRNIQEVRIIKLIPGDGWQIKIFRRFAIDSTIFNWLEI